MSTTDLAESAARRWEEFRRQRARHDALAHKAPVRGSLSRQGYIADGQRRAKRQAVAAAILAMRGRR